LHDLGGLARYRSLPGGYNLRKLRLSEIGANHLD